MTMNEKEKKPMTVRAKELAALVAKDLHIERSKSQSKSKSPEIYTDELRKSVEEIIAEEARQLWRKETGRRIPKEGVPEEYHDKAMISVLKRWQKTLKEIKETVPKMAPPPPPLDKALIAAHPVCPECGEPMKRVVGRLYQCPRHPHITRLMPEVPQT